MLCVDLSKVALAGLEHDGHDVRAHLVDQAGGKKAPYVICGEGPGWSLSSATKPAAHAEL